MQISAELYEFVIKKDRLARGILFIKTIKRTRNMPGKKG